MNQVNNYLCGLSLRFPKQIIWLSALLLLVCTFGLHKLVKDTSVDAFIPKDHPSITARDKVQEVFGLKDPILVSLQTHKDGIFDKEYINALNSLHHEIERLDNIRADRLKSLVSEPYIEGDELSLTIEPLIKDSHLTNTAEVIKNKLKNMPIFIGTLVTEDFSASMIVVELNDQKKAEDSYQQILALSKKYNTDTITVHVAGQAAVSSYFSKYIDKDARKVQPLAFATIIILLFVAFRKIKAVISPVVVIVAAALGTLGLMAWSDVPYYAITGALPVVLVAISVADAIHILSAYYKYQAQDPLLSTRQLIEKSLAEMSAPITVTSLTTMAGFLALAASSIMPPITYFGLFAALGVFIAWLFSMLVLPAILLLMNLAPSSIFAETTHSKSNNLLGPWLSRFSMLSLRFPYLISLILAGIIAASVYGASLLTIDRVQIENFTAEEPIRMAHDHINKDYAGAYYLDVVIRSAKQDGVLDPEVMSNVVELQQFLNQQPNVTKTLGLTDYLGLLDNLFEGRSINVGKVTLPDSAEAMAQYLLLYEMSSSIEDFADEIDNQYQQLLIRVYVNADSYVTQKPIILAAERYLQDQFCQGCEGITYELSGRVNVDYHWMERLQSSHFTSVIITLITVGLIASLLFRSFNIGVISLLPVVVTVTIVYAVMALTGIALEPSTSMFAAIAIGIGIDFSIHLQERLIVGKQKGHTLEQSIERYFPVATRACFFNAFGLGLGFSILMLSALPTLQRFGLMISVACLTSFFAALLIIPLGNRVLENIRSSLFITKMKWVSSSTIIILVLGLSAYSSKSKAEEDLAVETIIQNVWQREEAQTISRYIEMTMTTASGKEQKRFANVLRINNEVNRKSLIRFTKPLKVKKTTLLTYDYLNKNKTDEQWVYLPALKKTRRIPSSSRGKAFMGTDFSYEDIKSDLKFDPSEYEFSLIEKREDGYIVQGVTKTKELTESLGYHKMEVLIDSQSWLPMSLKFFTKGELFKHIEVKEKKKIEGIWTATIISARNLRSNHNTEFRYSNISFSNPIDPKLLSVSRIGGN